MDPKYSNPTVGKFIARMMERGKKSTATRVMYDAFAIIQEKVGKEPLEVFQKALDNVKPVVEVKSRRVGGSTYQVPVEIREERRNALGMRWIISYARARHGRSMAEKLERRAHRRLQFRRQRVQEEGRHPPHGGGQQGLLPLPVVSERLTERPAPPWRAGLVAE